MRCCVSVMVLTVLLCLAFDSQAQHDQVWAFGNKTGLDFNTSPPTIITTMVTGDNNGECYASVSDDQGQLLFYTDGSTVFNRNHAMMVNGDDLTGFGPGATGSSSQGALIVKIPGSQYRYLLFSVTSYEMGPVNRGRLFYSEIDMSLDNGNGAVVPGRKTMAVDTGIGEAIAGYAGCDAWVIVRNQTADYRFKAFRVTEAGLDPVPVVSDLPDKDIGYVGKLQVSPDGRILADSKASGIRLYDFDPATGVIANERLIVRGSIYGLAFSPDGSKLYYCVYQSGIFQYDIANNNHVLRPVAYINILGTSIKAGPDGRMYFMDKASSIGYLTYPNRDAADVGYVAAAFSLPQSGFTLGLPNIPAIVIRDTVSRLSERDYACFPGTVQLEALDTGGRDYRWAAGDTGKVAYVQRTGIYAVQYYTGSCTLNRDSFEVHIGAALPEIHTIAACAGQPNGTARIDRGSVPGQDLTIQWRDTLNGSVLGRNDTLDGIPAGTYWLYLRSGSCDTVLHVEVPVENNILDIDFPEYVCVGQPFDLSHTADPYYTSYQWQFGDGQGSADVQPRHAYARTGVYTLRVIAAGDRCRDTLETVITADAADTGLHLVISPAFACAGAEVTLSVPHGDGLLSQAWMVDGVEEQVTKGGPVTFMQGDPGIYKITVTSRYRACPEVFTEGEVSVKALPDIDLGGDTSVCPNAEPVVLHNRADTGDGNAHYVWSTGAETRQILVREAGDYTLEITDGYGCRNHQTVHVARDCYVDVPNVFSPDGDGVNDFFFPGALFARGVTEFRFRVYNRWGQLLYQTDNHATSGWDGSYEGISQPSGVYIYAISVRFSNGRSENLQGNVTLLR